MGLSDLRAEDFRNDETKFIIGIDLGNSCSCVSYYDFNMKKTQILDISGGYSKASVPTVVQYVPENDEWIFGEYAVLNRPMGNEITFCDIIKNMGKKLVFNAGEKKISLCYALSLFINELMNGIKSINPNAEICAVMASVPAYITDEAKEEIRSAFNMSCCGESFMGFADERECILNYYFSHKAPEEEEVLLLDYGDRGLRANLFEIKKEKQELRAICGLSLEDKENGTDVSEKALEGLFEKYYYEETGNDSITDYEKKELSVFSYEHFDLFLQRENKNGIKLYYTFCYPPVKKTVSKEETEEFIKPFLSRLCEFLNAFKDYDCRVAAVGGGFERIWAKKALTEGFEKDRLRIFAKEANACGACLSACIRLKLISGSIIRIEDRQKIKDEIGIMQQGSGFIALSEKNSFWWQEQKKRIFIVDDSEEKDYLLEIYKKSGDKAEKISELRLDRLKGKKEKTSKISICIKYESFNSAFIEVKDLGFGEIQESSGLDEGIEIRI